MSHNVINHALESAVRSIHEPEDLSSSPAPCVGDKRNSDSTNDGHDADVDMDQPRLKRRATEDDRRPILLETHKRTQPHYGRSSTQPRWHNQSYMLFLALRQHPDQCLPRTELIKAALAMDKKISEERHLPKVFRGKTPMNSASAILTNNSDRYFIPFRPEGSRSMHFKLAYEPGNFTKAVQEYRKWEKKLAEHDWPYCFGVPKKSSNSMKESNDSNPTNDDQHHEKPKQEAENDLSEHAVATSSSLSSSSSNHTKFSSETTVVESAPVVVVTEFDTFIARRKSDQAILEENNKRPSSLSSSSVMRIAALDDDKENKEDSNQIVAVRPSIGGIASEEKEKEKEKGEEEEEEEEEKEQKKKKNNDKDDVATSTEEQLVNLEDLDLTDVPQSWKDILRVDESKIAGAGKGLFATRRLPGNTPLGFYFGVPMTEDEFDSLKDGVGRASEYSMMYRKTVLDATNEEGYPYNDPDGEMYCPFHFMNETNQAGANMVFVEGALVNQVICWTKRDIEEGEELLVWYGRDVDRHWDSK
ncbi:hypothetical protein EC973_000165 [Apophysomyces ossiformis]|uniref:SET domain-containing protein n=1 Tax=Apophysomyces ossiformis TaxID=679940 RepID=A0A8H7BZW5_9FUNG|nr:hypothetical protein EC973_000165 [Apophysomyces ossiformis]